MEDQTQVFHMQSMKSPQSIILTVIVVENVQETTPLQIQIHVFRKTQKEGNIWKMIQLEIPSDLRMTMDVYPRSSTIHCRLR